jgi:hypothetical protein
MPRALPIPRNQLSRDALPIVVGIRARAVRHPIPLQASKQSIKCKQCSLLVDHHVAGAGVSRLTTPQGAPASSYFTCRWLEGPACGLLRRCSVVGSRLVRPCHGKATFNDIRPTCSRIPPRTSSQRIALDYRVCRVRQSLVCTLRRIEVRAPVTRYHFCPWRESTAAQGRIAVDVARYTSGSPMPRMFQSSPTASSSTPSRPTRGVGRAAAPTS